MDKKELQEKIALYYSKLPPNAQVLFSSMKWLENLKTISQKYALDEKQIETLGTETTLVLLGIIHPVEYEEMLTKELKLSVDSTDKILTEIEESIIKTVRPQLVTVFETNKKSETEEVKIEQKLDRHLEKLPKEIENIVKGSNYQATLYTIAKGYSLNVEQMGVLEKAVTDLIAGAIYPDEFEGYLENNLKISLETVRKIVNDINEKIFKKIRAKIKGSPEVEENPPLPESSKREVEKLNTSSPQPLSISKNGEGKARGEENKPQTPKIDVHSLLAQKLSGNVQNKVVETNHSLPNIAPSSKPTVGTKLDPYREMPE